MPLQAIRIQARGKGGTGKGDKNKGDERKSIVFFARQHPGEIQGSYAMEGIINYILAHSTEQWVKNFVFHFVPMVNPEGVILGNYRTNVKGYDLNRNWRNPTNDAQPEVIAIKKYLNKINK